MRQIVCLMTDNETPEKQSLLSGPQINVWIFNEKPSADVIKQKLHMEQV